MEPSVVDLIRHIVSTFCATCSCAASGDCIDPGGVLGGLGALASGALGRSPAGSDPDPGSDPTGSVSRNPNDPRDRQRDRMRQHYDDYAKSYEFQVDVNMYRLYQHLSEAIGGKENKASLAAGGEHKG